MIARPIAGAPRPYRFPEFTHQRLDNGLGVWLVPLPDRELVSIHLLTDAGAASEDEAHAGLAGLTAQVLVTGTRRLDASAFAEATERLGIEVGSESSWDSARAGFTALGSKLDQGLGLLAEMVRTPRLDAGEFDRIKSERLNDILQARADPGRLADESFLRELFAETEPYGRLSAGRPETVEALTVEDARAFHASHYAPNVIDVIIAGAITPDTALAAAERHLGGGDAEADDTSRASPVGARSTRPCCHRRGSGRTATHRPTGRRSRTARVAAAAARRRPGRSPSSRATHGPPR